LDEKNWLAVEKAHKNTKNRLSNTFLFGYLSQFNNLCSAIPYPTHNKTPNQTQSSMAKPQLVRGTRDFGPQQVYRRQFIFDTLRKIFLQFGFEPLETPAMESLDTLMGKYGEEGDRLLYKILNNGDFLEKVPSEALQNSKQLLRHIADRGLRYDLTVPFARYVSMNRHALAFPFKRYQIQPVWRGDNPQHGRYREFYQCDVDVVGSPSLLYEAELLQIYDQAFAALGIGVVLRLNNRKILEGLAHYAGHPELFVPITVAIDKMDKIFWTGVREELGKLGLEEDACQRIQDILNIKELSQLKTAFAQTPIGLRGVEELEKVLSLVKNYRFKNKLSLDFTLARGLSYYTGCIFEVVVDTALPGQEAVKMGSIGGGGRYDDLTGVFGMPGVSGVGVSFGADRIYDVLEQLNGFANMPQQGPQILFLPMTEEAQQQAFDYAQSLRQWGFRVAIYPDVAKFKKQIEYANKINIPFVGILGETELAAGKIQVKNMLSGEQNLVSIEDIKVLLQA
jgi:histidyl-tRNA synthetase